MILFNSFKILKTKLNNNQLGKNYEIKITDTVIKGTIPILPKHNENFSFAVYGDLRKHDLSKKHGEQGSIGSETRKFIEQHENKKNDDSIFSSTTDRLSCFLLFNSFHKYSPMMQMGCRTLRFGNIIYSRCSQGNCQANLSGDFSSLYTDV